MRGLPDLGVTPKRAERGKRPVDGESRMTHYATKQ